MSATSFQTRRLAIRQTLAQRRMGSPATDSGAETAFRTWHQVANQLVPIIGQQGVCSLFNRSIDLASKHYLWLLLAKNYAPGEAQLSHLLAWYESPEASAAAEANYLLLVTFTDLLASLIGEFLTDQILNPVWSSHLAPPEQEKNHEA